jgi:hypothetical protein
MGTPADSPPGGWGGHKSAKMKTANRVVVLPGVDEITILLDPGWSVCKRYGCGHIQHACCLQHIDEICQICHPPDNHVDPTNHLILKRMD